MPYFFLLKYILEISQISGLKMSSFKKKKKRKKPTGVLSFILWTVTVLLLDMQLFPNNIMVQNLVHTPFHICAFVE